MKIAPHEPVRDSSEKTTAIRTVTCFIVQSGRILLQERPVGRIWAGMLNGPGGKVDPGEDAADAIVRETIEETGLMIVDPQPRGSLVLHLPSPRLQKLTVDIFVATATKGSAAELEGELSWHERDALPFDRMWADQRYWLQAVLDGFSVDGDVTYEGENLRLASCQLRLYLQP